MNKLLAAVALVSTFFAASSAQALPEKEVGSALHSTLLPFYDSGEAGTLIGQEGVALRYRVFLAPREIGTIVISNGRTESSAKYSELIFDLHEAGYSVFIMDHRGQGFSGRMLEDPAISYVEKFEYYVADLKQFVETVVKPHHPAKLFLLAHSMGGAIASSYVETHPGDFRAAVLSSPMLQLDTGRYPEPLAYLIARTSCQLGNARKLALGQTGYAAVPFDRNILTRSEARYSALVQETEAEHPEARMGGVSYRWVQKALEATGKIGKDASQVQIPVLLFQAGQDKIVKPGGQNRFCARILNCRMIQFPDSEHEILMERDEIRSDALREALGFFGQN